MAETLQQLLRQRRQHDTPAVKYGRRTWTWREHLAEASATAATLLGNTPEMLTAMASVALGGPGRLCTLRHQRHPARAGRHSWRRAGR